MGCRKHSRHLSG